MKNIPPSDMAQIKAKVAAMGALQGLRQDWGCRRAWARDYLSSVSARWLWGIAGESPPVPGTTGTPSQPSSLSPRLKDFHQTSQGRPPSHSPKHPNAPSAPSAARRQFPGVGVHWGWGMGFL